ncbi:MAG: lysophospholipid acyltransferase family protein [Gammaproteobacteria bacterium]|nr:lysophospholipid acyltransferase family protein [Gammaproteobacteria bacterium]
MFAYRWLVIAPFLALSTTVFAILVIIVSAFGYPSLASRLFGRLWARVNAAVSLISIEVEGTEHIDPNTSYVIAANHQSLVDIYVLYGYLPVDFKWVMKQELRSVPMLGAACDMIGHIYIDRSNTEAALKSIKNARSRISRGTSVVFFPEGTRSRDGRLKTFKRGAFRLAIDLGIPILPVIIHDTRHVLPSDSTELVPGHVRLEIGDPISTEGLTSDDAHELSDRTRRAIARSLNDDNEANS